MNFQQSPFAPSGGVTNTLSVSAPTPSTTGVSLSERFGALPTRPPTATNVVKNQNFGLGLPNVLALNPSGLSNKRAVAISYANMSQIDTVRNKRRIIGIAGRGRGRGWGGSLPVTARLGPTHLVSQSKITSRGRGVVRSGRGARGGLFHMIQRGGASAIKVKKIQISKVSTLRGALQANRGTIRGRGTGGLKHGSGISPMNRANSNRENKSKEDLDKELDFYMAKSKTRLKTDLDKELDEYMMAARAQAEAVAASASSSVHIEADTDVAMSET